ncbi:MAG: hypothetical protein PVF54_01975 [Anaerolineae bacterium]
MTLHVFSEMEETDAYTATLGADQAFSVDDVTLREGQTVVARTVYDGVTYVSEPLTVGSAEHDISLPITVFETMAEPIGVSVAQLHVFVDKLGDELQIGEYCVVANTGDRTYVGSRHAASGDRRTWSISLPDGADNLRFDGAELGGRFVALDDGFADTRPILPGDAGAEISFSYQVPYRDRLEVGQAFDLPVAGVVLVLPEGDWTLVGDGLSSAGTLDTQMGPALSYTAGPLAAGDPLVFRVVPVTSSGAVAAVEGSGGLAVGIAALAAAGAAVYWMWRSPSSGSVPAKVLSQVEAMAALDRAFEAGQTSEKTYRSKRRALKRRVLAQMSEGRGQ